MTPAEMAMCSWLTTEQIRKQKEESDKMTRAILEDGEEIMRQLQDQDYFHRTLEEIIAQRKKPEDSSF